MVKSLERAGIQTRQHYRWLEMDPWYLAAFTKAREAVADVVESELLRRATEDWDEPVFNHRTGEVMGRIRKYDSRLMEVVARAVLKDRGYGNDVNLTGKLQVEPVQALSVEELRARAVQLLQKLGPETPAIEGEVVRR